MKTNEPLNLRAVMTGFLSDMGGTYLFLFALLIVLYNPGSSSVCLAERIEDPLPLNLLLMIVGIGITALGGFVAARLAGRDGLRHGMAVGCLSLVASFFMCNFDFSPLSLLGYVLTIPMAGFGGMCANLFPPSQNYR